MTPPIIVITNEKDFAADAVIAHLHVHGTDVQRVNVESAVAEPVWPWSPHDHAPPRVFWWRQFELDDRPDSIEAVDEILVARAQWRVWLSTLDVPGSRWINPLWAARRAENKVTQLRTAANVGFDVPETVITNDRQQADKLAARVGDVVVKTLTSAYFAFSDQSFVFTEALDHEALEDPRLWHATPVIVQRRLTGAADARVISFGDHAFGATTMSPGLDWRKTPFDADRWQTTTPPANVARRCDEYRTALGLEYVAFDFMVENGTWWFLEANQAGEFSFIDRTLDLGIASAIGNRLIEMQQSIE